MKKLKPKKLLVNVKDTQKLIDRPGTYKKWFNGIKFFTLRILPPK